MVNLAYCVMQHGSVAHHLFICSYRLIILNTVDSCFLDGCRGVEFLAVIGGLWNSCLFVGIVLWMLAVLVLRFDDHTYVYGG